MLEAQFVVSLDLSMLRAAFIGEPPTPLACPWGAPDMPRQITPQLFGANMKEARIYFLNIFIPYMFTHLFG